ncbi:hypothetical protein FB451DRAFT_1179381 [Mycena latifolia]|nr:hypothetical protein FB451DRAFT_1179381 [Mycena latifolia]
MTHILYVTSTCSKLDEPNDVASKWTGAWVTPAQKQCFLTAETTGLFFEEWPSKDDFIASTRPGDFHPVLMNKMHNLAILQGHETDATNLDAQHGMLWLVQDLIPELRLYGEYRSDQVQGYPEPQDVLVRHGGSADQRRESMQTLHHFVLWTLHGLIAEAERMWDAPLLLREFVRIDVSFMEKGDGQPGYDYFVNEVELGGNGVCLFSGYSKLSEMVIDELLTAILACHASWVKARHPVVQAKPRAKTPAQVAVTPRPTLSPPPKPFKKEKRENQLLAHPVAKLAMTQGSVR